MWIHTGPYWVINWLNATLSDRGWCISIMEMNLSLWISILAYTTCSEFCLLQTVCLYFCPYTSWHLTQPLVKYIIFEQYWKFGGILPKYCSDVDEILCQGEVCSRIWPIQPQYHQGYNTIMGPFLASAWLLLSESFKHISSNKSNDYSNMDSRLVINKEHHDEVVTISIGNIDAKIPLFKTRGTSNFRKC